MNILLSQPMVNFINVLRANFFYKSLFGSFFYLHVTRAKLPKRHSYKKFARKMLMKLTPKRQNKSENIFQILFLKRISRLFFCFEKLSNLLRKITLRLPVNVK